MQFGLLVDFDSNLLVDDPVETKSDDSVGTLTDTLPDKVAVQVLDGGVDCAEFVLGRLPILQVLEHFVLRMSILFLLERLFLREDCLGRSNLCQLLLIRWTKLIGVVING